MKARNLIHARIEENIRAKIGRLRAAEADGGCKDALQLLIEDSWERGERLDMQVRGGCPSGEAELGSRLSARSSRPSPPQERAAPQILITRGEGN